VYGLEDLNASDDDLNQDDELFHPSFDNDNDKDDDEHTYVNGEIVSSDDDDNGDDDDHDDDEGGEAKQKLAAQIEIDGVDEKKVKEGKASMDHDEKSSNNNLPKLVTSSNDKFDSSNDKDAIDDVIDGELERLRTLGYQISLAERAVVEPELLHEQKASFNHLQKVQDDRLRRRQKLLQLQTFDLYDEERPNYDDDSNDDAYDGPRAIDILMINDEPDWDDDGIDPNDADRGYEQQIDIIEKEMDVPVDDPISEVMTGLVNVIEAEAKQRISSSRDTSTTATSQEEALSGTSTLSNPVELMVTAMKQVVDNDRHQKTSWATIRY
jgi:hypothetical protein